jgi:hypothetical protein
MTPDELPADMEAVVARLEMSAIDPVPWPDLRALLKAYQEQRRALEPLRRPHWTDDKAIDDLDEDAVIDLTVTVGEFRRIRAALNQKGDER